MFRYFVITILCVLPLEAANVRFGVDVLLDHEHAELLRGKRIGLITNHTGINSQGQLTSAVLKKHFQVVALFGPEHGIKGNLLAGAVVPDSRDSDGIPIYGLEGPTRRPTSAMLEGVEVLVYDIQDVGCRCYTYASTLYYAMEEAAARQIPVVVLDRPNPINGLVVDGPFMQEEKRSFVGYLDIPFCHGMTIGELARWFNAEYKVGCALTVVPMQGWTRDMSYRDTGLLWVPASPQVPEPDTCLTYPATALLGECLTDLSIGIGYTLPFKIVGAPWINGDQLAEALNKQNFPGVSFYSHRFSPFFGRHAHKECEGVRIAVTDSTSFKPVSTQFLILSVLKLLYPEQFAQGVVTDTRRIAFLAKVAGSDAIYQKLHSEGPIAWSLIGLDQERREAFLKMRKPYLLYDQKS